MELLYFESLNFGDNLNPYIFNKLLPDFFDGVDDVSFVGIGSLLGFKYIQNAKNKVIFSTGYAYGASPQIDESYDIFCVRGPLTCEALGIDKKFSVADGALLLQFLETPSTNLKKYDFSYIPHWESFKKFNWEPFLNNMGINLINPLGDTEVILHQIQSTKVLLAEAMHGAIVADVLRVPWVPVKAYEGINTFKWRDWAASMDLSYKPHFVNSLYSNTQFTRKVIKEKLKYPLSPVTLKPALYGYQFIQRFAKLKTVEKQFEKLKKVKPILSDEKMVKEKGEILLSKLEEVKAKYS